MRVRSSVVVLLLAAATACSEKSDPLTYSNRRAFTPPMETYITWWERLEQCTKRTRNITGVRWYLADWISGGESIYGQWLSSREITLKAGFELDERVVKHEMLHDLLDGDGTHEHFGWRFCVPR